MKDLSQKPEEKYVDYNSRNADRNMILHHPFKVIQLSWPSPISPGPEIIQDEIVQNRKFNG
jgi:hypothetical protein